MTALAHILENKIVAIIRGAAPAHVPKIVHALYEGGINTLEITLNSASALTLIELIVRVMGDRVLVGAGTVLDAASARAAIEAGAQFIISPALDLPTIQETKRLNRVSIPGAFTPTEVLAAYNGGGDLIKIFPARLGPGYLRDLRGPLHHIPMMPTGGVDLQNIRAFQQAGAVAFGIGSALVDTAKEMTPQYLTGLTATARQYVQAVKSDTI